MSAPDDTVPRQRLSAAERRTLLQRQAFRCAACPEPLVIEVGGRRLLAAMVDEHILPLALGGSNDLANRELRCPACAKAKTSRDLKAILKVRRIQRREIGEAQTRPKIRSRPFPRDPLSWRNAEPRS